jgi:hypothetical protein
MKPILNNILSKAPKLSQSDFFPFYNQNLSTLNPNLDPLQLKLLAQFLYLRLPFPLFSYFAIRFYQDLILYQIHHYCAFS